MHRLILSLTLLRQQGGKLTGLWSEFGLAGQTTHLDQTWQLQTSEFVRGIIPIGCMLNAYRTLSAIEL